MLCSRALISWRESLIDDIYTTALDFNILPVDGLLGYRTSRLSSGFYTHTARHSS